MAASYSMVKTFSTGCGGHGSGCSFHLEWAAAMETFSRQMVTMNLSVSSSHADTTLNEQQAALKLCD